jgi:modulator of FtsH protease
MTNPSNSPFGHSASAQSPYGSAANAQSPNDYPVSPQPSYGPSAPLERTPSGPVPAIASGGSPVSLFDQVASSQGRNPYEELGSGSPTDRTQQQKVLRNTYGLLALSMIPTIAGAWIGVQTQFSAIFSGSPFVGAIAFLAIAFGFFYVIERNKHSAAGVWLLLAFTFFMGLMLSGLIGSILGLRNGATLIMTAFGGTASIFAVMASIATFSKRDFTGLGKFLMMGVLVLILASLANIFLQLPALMLTVSVLAIAIFSALILVDVQRVLRGGEDNYITATLAIYLNVYNIFANLLAILGIFGGDRD